MRAATLQTGRVLAVNRSSTLVSSIVNESATSEVMIEVLVGEDAPVLLSLGPRNPVDQGVGEGAPPGGGGRQPGGPGLAGNLWRGLVGGGRLPPGRRTIRSPRHRH